MSLLVEATILGETKYISNEPIALSNRYYDPYILKIGSIKVGIPTKHGGYSKLTYSNFALSPDIFENIWPPPMNIYIVARYSNSDGTSSKKLFETTAHRSNVTRSSVEYRFYGNDYTEVLTDQVFSGTLLSIFETYTGQSHLGLRLNSIFSRDPSPAVSYTASGELLDILSDIAAFFSHMFYIDGDILYLVDMLQANTTRETNENETIASPRYRDNPPINSFVAGSYSIDGSYPYGSKYNVSPVCHSTQANIESALADIKTTVEKQSIEVAFPLEYDYIVRPGQEITMLDESLRYDSGIELKARGIVYDFDKDEFTITGDGVMSLN